MSTPRVTKDEMARIAADVEAWPRELGIPRPHSPEFAESAHRESVAIADSPREAGDQAWVDAISVPFDELD